MGLGASFGKTNGKNSNTYSGIDNSSSNANFTTTPTNAPWATDLATKLAGNVTALSGTNPQSYIANANPLYTQAAATAGLIGPQSENYANATGVTQGVASSSGPDIAGGISRFMNPYTDSVVNSTLADYDHQAGLTRAQDDLRLAGSGAFGGSGSALTKSATEGELARGRATTESGVRSQGFNTALQGATAQAGLDQNQQAMKLQAGQQLANIANQYGANDRANIATQVSAAQPLQAIDQSKAQAPLDFQAILGQLFAGTNPGLFQGQTGNENQTGTETQSGTSSGKTSSTNFGIGFK